MDAVRKQKLIAAFAFLPVAVGFLLLFFANFLLIVAALLFFSMGALSAPVGALYLAGILSVVSDLSPAALTVGGIFCIFFGIFLALAMSRLAPLSIRLFHRYVKYARGEKYRRVYHLQRFRFLFWVALALSVLLLGITAFLQSEAVKDGFTSTVVRRTQSFENCRYITVSTTNLDLEVRHYDGGEILIEYVNDSPIITVESDENYLKLTQDDMFTLSLFALEQFEYKMILWLPENDYREIILSSGSGRIYLAETQSEFTSIHTRSGMVTVDDAYGKLEIETISGNLHCNYIAFVNAGTFKSKSGNITVMMPDYSNVRLQFETTSGTLRTNMFESPQTVRENVTLTRGSDFHYLYITTESGGVSLRKSIL